MQSTMGLSQGNSETESSIRMESTTKEEAPRKGGRLTMMSNIPQSTAHFEEGDEDNPRNWPLMKKIPIGVFVVVAGCVANLGIPVYFAAAPGIARSFQLTSTTVAILPASLYAFGLGFGALVATAASEIFSRGIVYKATFPLFFVFTIVAGSAQNYSTLAAARFLSGFLAGPCVSIGAGVLNDIWNISLDKIGTVFGVLYVMGIIWATQVGPMMSGSLMVHYSWRWVFWLLAILVGFLAVVAFLIPETFAPQILRSRAKKQKSRVEKRGDSWGIFLVSIGRPLHMIIVEPFVLSNSLALAVVQSVIFAYYILYTILFEQIYGFSQYSASLLFAPLFIGSLIAVPVLGAFDRVFYQKAREQAIRSGTRVHPEMRLYPAMLGVLIQPISLFWLAWTGRPSVHWIVPGLSGAFFGLSYALIIMSILLYNNDVYYLHYSASVLAATTFLRYLISSSFPLFTSQMVHNLGFAWATSLLAFITLAIIPIPWVFFKWGPSLRARTRYLAAEVRDEV